MKSRQNNINQHIKLEPIDNDRLANLCGLLDKNIRQIEIFFDVEISNRGNSFKITGDNENVANTSNFIERMYDLSGNEEITPKQLHLYLNNLEQNFTMVFKILHHFQFCWYCPHFNHHRP